MTEDTPIHLVLRVDKRDIEYSISYWSKLKNYIWWSYHGGKALSEDNIKLLNENIDRFKSNFVYFCAEGGEYVKKAQILGVDGKGIKNDKHVPTEWEEEADLWIKCDDFEDEDIPKAKKYC